MYTWYVIMYIIMTLCYNNVQLHYKVGQVQGAEQAMGQWVKWVTILDGRMSHVSSYCDP